MIADSVAYLRADGREVFYDAEHFFDGFTAQPRVRPANDAGGPDGGAELVILCDTNGGTSARGDRRAAWTRQEEPLSSCRSASTATTIATWPSANSLAAVRQGATQVQGTINGIGERCGNVDLVSVIANLALEAGREVLLPEAASRG